MTKTQSDFILSSDRKIVGNCEVITKVDIGSDDRLVRARVEMKKKLMRLQKIQQQNPLQSDFSFKSISHFRIELNNLTP